jgi:hypothetical protein
MWMGLRCAALFQKIPHEDRIVEFIVRLFDSPKPSQGQEKQILELGQIHFGQVVLERHEELVILIERKQIRRRIRMLCLQAAQDTIRCVALFGKKYCLLKCVHFKNETNMMGALLHSAEIATC